jgi:hypothetical protein
VPHGSPGVLHERREDWRWRAEQAELTFETPGGKEHGAQRSVPCPGNEVFALWSRTGTRHCLVAVTGTGASTASVFGSDALDFSREPGLDTGAGLGFPERFRASGPDIPGNTSKPKGRPRKYQSGASSWSVPPEIRAWRANNMFPR